jgi:hypothetical protein
MGKMGLSCNAEAGLSIPGRLLSLPPFDALYPDPLSAGALRSGCPDTGVLECLSAGRRPVSRSTKAASETVSAGNQIFFA